MKLLQWIDDRLNSITMYALVTYSLSLLVTIGIILGLTNTLRLSGSGLIASSLIVMSTGFVSSRLLALVFRAIPNFESSIITCLIIILLLPPATSWQRALLIGLTTIISMASKYLIVWRHKHLFNPAAVAAVAVSVTGLLPVTWWVANPTMFPLVLIIGILVVRKVRCFQMVSVFVLAATVTFLLTSQGNQTILADIRSLFLSWPLVFMGTIMLTEPSTMPSSKDMKILYALLVGVIFSSQLQIGGISITPQVALIVGNLFAFVVSPKVKSKIELQAVEQITPTVKDYIFSKPKNIYFEPGQYLEWTVPALITDIRGNRRTFSIASSPTESNLRIGVKFYQPGSDYKRRLAAMQPGDKLVVGQLAGDFTLSNNSKQPMVFIAGGIGITPFRSMIKYLIDKKQNRQVILIYAISSMKEAAYGKLLQSANKLGLKTVYVVSEGEVPAAGYKGYVTEKIISREVPDYKNCTFYISGPSSMVRAMKSLLRGMKVSSHRIRTDYFSGY